MTIKNLIDGIPRILEDIPGLAQNLERTNGWLLDKTPSYVLKKWDSQTNEVKFYFFGWLRQSIKNNGVFTLVRFLGLREKRALSLYLDSIIEEATLDELKSFERGEKETFRRRRR